MDNRPMVKNLRLWTIGYGRETHYSSLPPTRCVYVNLFCFCASLTKQIILWERYAIYITVEIDLMMYNMISNILTLLEWMMLAEWL